MYGNCPECGKRYGTMDAITWYPLCIHMSEKQKEFMNKKIKISDVLRGGKGSGKKAFPITIEKLRIKH